MKETLTISRGGIAFPSGAVIHDITESAPAGGYTAIDRGRGYGQRVTGHKRQYLDVSVSFAFLGKLNQTQRAAKLDAVIAWANGGSYITVGHHPGRRLECNVLQLPARSKQQKWEQDYTLSFRAYDVPFWVDSASTALTIGANTITGTAPAPLCASITGACSSIKLMAGGDMMQFSGLTMTEADTFTLSVNGSIVTAAVGSTSVLDKLTSASSDVIMLQPGSTTVSATIVGTPSATALTYKARWA